MTNRITIGCLIYSLYNSSDRSYQCCISNSIRLWLCSTSEVHVTKHVVFSANNQLCMSFPQLQFEFHKKKNQLLSEELHLARPTMKL